MPKEDISKRHFREKISTYCDVRILNSRTQPNWSMTNSGEDGRDRMKNSCLLSSTRML